MFNAMLEARILIEYMRIYVFAYYFKFKFWLFAPEGELLTPQILRWLDAPLGPAQV
jgi:hypothetical protein